MSWALVHLLLLKHDVKWSGVKWSRSVQALKEEWIESNRLSSRSHIPTYSGGSSSRTFSKIDGVVYHVVSQVESKSKSESLSRVRFDIWHLSLSLSDSTCWEGLVTCIIHSFSSSFCLQSICYRSIGQYHNITIIYTAIIIGVSEWVNEWVSTLVGFLDELILYYAHTVHSSLTDTSNAYHPTATGMICMHYYHTHTASGYNIFLALLWREMRGIEYWLGTGR